MAEQKPLKGGASGLEQFTGTDTLPVANVPDITSTKVTDFTEAAQDAVGAKVKITAIRDGRLVVSEATENA